VDEYKNNTIMNDTKNVSLSGIWENADILLPGFLGLVVNSPFQDFPSVEITAKTQAELEEKAKRYPFPRYSSVAIYNYEREKVWDAALPSTLHE
jgi:hypothetical protein